MTGDEKREWWGDDKGKRDLPPKILAWFWLDAVGYGIFANFSYGYRLRRHSVRIPFARFGFWREGGSRL